MSTGQAALATVQSQAKQAFEAAGKQFASATDMVVKFGKTVSKTVGKPK